MSIHLASMLNGYEECIQWLEEGDEELDGSDGWSDELIAANKSDCSAFIGKVEENEELAEAVAALDYSDGRMGHDFWLTRNGHGAGFWDRKELEDKLSSGKTIGDMLTDIAKTFRSVDIYKGDDNREYFA